MDLKKQAKSSQNRSIKIVMIIIHLNNRPSKHH